MNQDAFNRLTTAKARLINKQPFFAHLIFGLPLVEATWYKKTMFTDMQRIYYHPDFVLEHSIEELMGVLCHEALHVAFLHGLRLRNRNHKLWNIATDFVINLVVTDSGLKLPKDGLLDQKWKGMSAEEVYAELEKNAVKIEITFPGDGNGGPGEEGDEEPMWGGVVKPMNGDGEGRPLTQAELSELESEIKIRVKQAADVAKSRGKLPAGVEGLIEAIGKPKIDWKEYIQNWVSGHTPDDYTFVKPQKILMANYGIYMPSMQLNGAGVGVLSIDTSGSVSDRELVEYVTEIVGLIEICNPSKLFIIQHDAIVQKMDIWEAGMDFKNLKTKGRGGTCIQPMFRKVEEIDEPIDWLIAFTDMGIGDWGSAPDYPVLWAATGPDSAPYGTYIPLKDAI